MCPLTSEADRHFWMGATLWLEALTDQASLPAPELQRLLGRFNPLMRGLMNGAYEIPEALYQDLGERVPLVLDTLDDEKRLAMWLIDCTRRTTELAELIELSRTETKVQAPLIFLQEELNDLSNTAYDIGLSRWGRCAEELAHLLSQWLEAKCVATPALHDLLADTLMRFMEWRGKLEEGQPLFR